MNEIFSYQRNSTNVYGDPLEIRHRLDKFLGGNYARVVAATHSNDPRVALPAYEKLGPAVCAAFNLGLPFNEATGDGVLRSTWLAVLRSYIEWTEALKKNTDSTVTLQLVTAEAS